MGRQEVLRRLFIPSLVLATGLVGGLATAEPPRDRIRLPERLTAGPADQFLGALAPDGKHLYFVSAQNATLQIFMQDLTGGPALPLFDEAADCTSPRPSPDGKYLAYLSYRSDATGDVCIRDLATLERRCLTAEDTAESEVLWAGPDQLLAVTRQGLHEDVEIDRLARGGGSRQTLLFRDLSSPALSPDVKWLAYVPMERASRQVGPSFSSRALRAIALQRFARLHDQALQIVFDLPGKSGFPAFSSDGKWLYFAQYLDDTNLDGVIDALDRSTLFRVPFDGNAAAPVAAKDLAHPQQLTSVSWNCQYPSPGPPDRNSLITTCSLSGTLDVYELPADGATPPEWTGAKLDEELAAVSDRGERLLLLDRLLALLPVLERERGLREEMLRLHLERGALESATWVLLKLKPAQPAMVQTLLGELIAHRRSERALDQGQLSAAFLAEAKERLQRVTKLGSDGEGGVLTALVRAELFDVLGDKQAAVRTVASAAVSSARSPLVLQLFAARAADLYTALDRRAALLELQRTLAGHPAFEQRARLAYAERYVATLLRGAPRSQHVELLDGALRGQVGDDLRSRLQIERLLVDLSETSDTPQLEKLRAASFELYRQTDDFERRRNIVHVTVTRAASFDSEKILYDFANAWVSLLERGTAERRYAEKLYRDVLLERAYVDLREKRLPDARGRFYGITLQTESLEAWTGFLELRATEDPKKAQAELEQRVGKNPDDPVLRFGRAYLVARSIASLPAEQRLAALDQAILHLKVAARSLSRSRELNFLWARCLYARFLATGDRGAAQEAHTKLLLALDLSGDNARYRAIATELAGRVQAIVGNQRIALGHFQQRDGMPFADPAAALSHLLLQARSLQLLDREKDACATAERALSLTEQPMLRPYRPLVLDRTALHHLAAGEGEPAAKRYDELFAVLPKMQLPLPEAQRARFTTLLGRGGAQLLADRAKLALADLNEALALLDKHPEVAHPPARTPLSPPLDVDAVRGYRLILHGMRAEAHRRLKQLVEASAAQTLRRDLLIARYKDAKADEDLLSLGDAELHLGEYDFARHRMEDAAKHLSAAVTAAERFAEKSGTEVHPLRIRAITDLVTLRLVEPAGKGDTALEKRLATLLAVFARQPNPAWSADRTRLERDLASLVLRRKDDKP